MTNSFTREMYFLYGRFVNRPYVKGYQSPIVDPFVAPLLGFGSLFAPQNFDYECRSAPFSAQDDVFFVDFGSPFNAKQPPPSKRRR